MTFLLAEVGSREWKVVMIVIKCTTINYPVVQHARKYFYIITIVAECYRLVCIEIAGV